MITVTDLFCLYRVPGGATVAALRGMTLRVAAGERLVVHGPNGSGKTTLLRLLTGEVPPSSGSVVVDGVELAGASTARVTALRRTVLGFVDQHSGRTLRPELDVLDNIALQLRLAGSPRAAARAAAREALDALGLAGFAHRRPSTLSGGEAQRVAVCAAVAHGPRVLLADEPTGELDVDSADLVYDLLVTAAQRAQATLVLVTHDPRAARVAERVVRIRDGRLSEQWHPATPEQEELVVDDRGWVRLPEALRRRTGLLEYVSVAERDGAIVLDARDATPLPPPPAPSFPPPLAPATEALGVLADVSVRFGERVVLDGYARTVPPGELTLIRGRSGSGKSTVLRLLLGLLDPDTGTVSLAGRPLAGLSRSDRATLRQATVGVALQNGPLSESLDAYENVALARAARALPADPDAVAQTITGLGLEPVAHRPVRLLSGGERQRVALARAVAVQPPLLVLDEPTSQQDEAHAALIASALRSLAAAGTAVLCATHDPALDAHPGSAGPT